MDPSVAQAAAFAAQFHQPPPPPYQQPHQPPYSAELYPTPVTNPIPQTQTNNLSQPIPSHPSYAEMITAAISWENSQGKESGSSKRAIAKYIDRVYTNLPPTHSALLTHHLKRLKAAGQLVMVKNSYQLPSVAVNLPNLPRSVETQQPYEPQQPSVVDQLVTGAGTVTPKRKPGRPPKIKTPVSEPVFVPEPVSVQSPVVENGSSLGKRRRGRPAKEKNPAVEVVVPFVAPVTDVAVVSNGQVAKRRGRPAKVKAVVNGGVTGAVRVGRGRGRPKGIGMKVGGSNVMAVVAVEKKRGWPKGNKRGKRVVNASVARNVGAGAGVVKRRGRKPKGLGLGVGVGVGMGGVMKRRGRKPKGVGVVSVGVVEKKVYNGKPRGRPKKNSAIVKHTDRQGQETANEDLLKKLEDMQLKIRGAVEVLKPIIGNQSEPDALTALQQLEELSAMNTTAAPTALIESPLMTTVPIDMVAPPESTSEPEPLVPPPAPSMAFDEAPEMSMPSPYGMNVTGIENQQPMSWIES